MNPAPHQILGVPPDAAKAEIKKAWRRLALAHHPDHNRGDPKATETFLVIQKAYEAMLAHAPEQAPPRPPQPAAGPDDEKLVTWKVVYDAMTRARTCREWHQDQRINQFEQRFLASIRQCRLPIWAPREQVEAYWAGQRRFAELDGMLTVGDALALAHGLYLAEGRPWTEAGPVLLKTLSHNVAAAPDQRGREDLIVANPVDRAQGGGGKGYKKTPAKPSLRPKPPGMGRPRG